jgi:hypothetical protein
MSAPGFLARCGRKLRLYVLRVLDCGAAWFAQNGAVSAGLLWQAVLILDIREMTLRAST